MILLKNKLFGRFGIRKLKPDFTVNESNNSDLLVFVENIIRVIYSYNIF